MIKSSDPIGHNVRFTGFNNTGVNTMVAPNGEFNVPALEAETRPMKLQCDIHNWMTGYLLVLDHPFFATTAADGSFEIKDVPAGKPEPDRLAPYRVCQPGPGTGDAGHGEGGRGDRRGRDQDRPGQEQMTALSWRYRVGRVLQLLGLLILPFAIASELMEKVHLGQSMLIAAGGAVLFYVGVQLQRRGM